MRAVRSVESGSSIRLSPASADPTPRLSGGPNVQCGVQEHLQGPFAALSVCPVILGLLGDLYLLTNSALVLCRDIRADQQVFEGRKCCLGTFTNGDYDLLVGYGRNVPAGIDTGG